MTNGPAPIANEELLYRRIRSFAGGQACYVVEGSRIRFTAAAFLDPKKRPSVDRANLRNGDPHRSRLTKDDGIVQLQTGTVREIGVIEKKDAKGNTVSQHMVDVEAAPIDGNEAHAEITLSPEVGGKAFERLKEALARLATDSGWLVLPGHNLPAP